MQVAPWHGAVSGACGAALVVACGLSRLSAQQQGTFRTTVEYVRVDVSVTDTQDTPVTNLRREDFKLFEEGREQAIADFVPVVIPPALALGSEWASTGPVRRDVATNALPSLGSRAVVIVVDDQHLIEADVNPLQSVLHDLVAALSADDLIGLTFVGRSDLAVDLTLDRHALAASIGKVAGAIGFGHDARPPATAYGDYLHGARSTLFTVRNVVDALAQTDYARRVVVLLSAGLTIDFGATPCPSNRRAIVRAGQCSDIEAEWARTLGDELRTLYERADLGGVPVYTLDPRGIATPETAIRGTLGPRDDAREISRRIRFQNINLTEIATNTGGRAFVRQSDLHRAVTALVADTGSYYLLGYYPDPPIRDDEPRSIRVQVMRPDLRVRARSGYVPEQPVPAGVGREALEAALSSAKPLDAVTLRGTTVPVAIEGGRRRIMVAVEVLYPKALTGDRSDDELLVSMLVVDNDGRLRGESHKRVRVSLRDDDAAKPAVLFADVVSVPTEPVTVRVGVASAFLQATGSVFLPISRGPAEDNVWLGGLVLGRATASGPVSVSSPEARSVVPFQPALVRRFGAGEVLRVFARVEGSGLPDQVRARIEVVCGSSRREQPVELRVGERTGDRWTGHIDESVVLDGSDAGQCVLDLTAEGGGTRSSRRVAVEIMK